MCTGKFTLSRSKVVYGTPARMVGLVLILPLPILLFLGVMLGFGMLAQGRELTQQEIDRLKVLSVVLGVTVVLGCFITALCIAAAYGEPARKSRPSWPERDDEDFDRPRRPYHADEEEPPPRGYPPDDRYGDRPD